MLTSILLCLISIWLPLIESVNVESLRAHSSIFGLSLLADGNNTICHQELRDLKDAVIQGKIWGLKVLDASGRPPSGFLYGNNLWLGSLLQCQDIRIKKPLEIRLDKVNRTITPYDYPPFDFTSASVMLKHNNTVQSHMRLPLDYTIQLGLCVPKSCSQMEIFNLSTQYFSKTPLEFQKQYQTSLEVIKVRMLLDDAMWMLALPKTIIFLVIVTVIVILTVIGTVYDVKQHNKEKNLIRGHNNRICNGKNTFNIELTAISIKSDSVWLKTLQCFSFYSNVKKWSQTKVSKDSLPILHGLRFLAMVWVIYVHTTYFQTDFVVNPPHAMRLTEKFMAQIFSNSTYCVDTFLFLSGFLLTYTFYKSQSQLSGKSKDTWTGNIGKFLYLLLKRFLRLTPTYVIVLLLCNLVYTYYNQHSSLYFSERPDINCDQYWWRNILYINNLYPRSEMCLSWSWYLALDMQFFVIGCFLVLLSTMYFKISAVLVVILLLVQVVTTTYKSYIIGYIPTLDDQLEQLDAIYDLPWNRIGPYVVGLATGYFLVVKLQNKLVLKESTRLTLWVVFPLLNLWILFTLYTRQLSVEFSAFYMGVSRTLWGLGIGWFVVALSTGNARLLEKMFCYKAWIPLARLTYCSYLLNPLVVSMLALGSESGIVLSVPQMALSTNGVFLLTMVISFPFTLMFETPFILLTKLIFDSTTGKTVIKEKEVESDQKSDTSTTSVTTIN